MESRMGVSYQGKYLFLRPSLEQARAKPARIDETRTKRRLHLLPILGFHRDRDDGIDLPCTSAF